MWVLLALAPFVARGAGSAPDLIRNAKWTVWAARPGLSPETEIVPTPQGAVLRMHSPRFECYGKWIATAPEVVPGRAYQFDVLFRTEGVASEDVSVAAILTWRVPNGKGLGQRDYADVAPSPGGEWKRLSRLIVAPKGTASLGIELALRWTAGGTVYWRNPTLREAEAPASRPVRIVTTRMRLTPKPTVESNLAAMSAIVDRAGAEKPDVILLTEAPSDRGVSGSLEQLAETIPDGPSTRMLAEKARCYHSYIAVSLHEKEGGTIYNTALLLNRRGEVAGKYRKVHLATAEGERGITPGSTFPVFQTDFGMVGMLVCWDNWFPESARALRLKGAEIILLPIAGDGGPGHWDPISRARAIDNGVYLVSSSTYNNPSRIIDPNGEVLAETMDGIAVKEIDLAQHWRVRWLSVGDAGGEARSLYIKERRPDTYRALSGPSAPATPRKGRTK